MHRVTSIFLSNPICFTPESLFSCYLLLLLPRGRFALGSVGLPCLCISICFPLDTLFLRRRLVSWSPRHLIYSCPHFCVFSSPCLIISLYLQDVVVTCIDLIHNFRVHLFGCSVPPPCNPTPDEGVPCAFDPLSVCHLPPNGATCIHVVCNVRLAMNGLLLVMLSLSHIC